MNVETTMDSSNLRVIEEVMEAIPVTALPRPSADWRDSVRVVGALVDQIRAFATRAREAGTALTFSEYPDMVHVWHLLRGMTPDARRAIAEAGAFIRTHAGATSRARRCVDRGDAARNGTGRS
jgi:hypothetical protein